MAGVLQLGLTIAALAVVHRAECGMRVMRASFADTARAPAMRPVLDLARRAARSSAHALITGERGAGERSLARWIAVIAIAVPPLRERPGDIPALVARFLARSARAARITGAALAHLTAAPWPGDARELEAAIERAIALSGDGRDGPVIDVARLAGAVPGPGPVTSPDPRGRRSSPR